MKRLGIFGGTFNPIHLGHLRVAVEILEFFDLDRIEFIPSAQPPHKFQSNIVPASHRLCMTQLAIRSFPFFHCSDIEVQRQGLSYTIDTIREIRLLYPNDVQFYYLIGLDAFLAIHTWKSYEMLFNEIPFIVMSRPDKDEYVKNCDHLIAYIQKTISKDYFYVDQKKCIQHSQKQSIYYCQVTALDISASQIRALIENGQAIDYLMPESVADYIHDKKLYQTRNMYDQ